MFSCLLFSSFLFVCLFVCFWFLCFVAFLCFCLFSVYVHVLFAQLSVLLLRFLCWFTYFLIVPSSCSFPFSLFKLNVTNLFTGLTPALFYGKVV